MITEFLSRYKKTGIFNKTMEKPGKVNIRNAESNDFDDIFPLLKQLWPDRKLDKHSLQNVFERLVEARKVLAQATRESSVRFVKSSEPRVHEKKQMVGLH